MPDSEDKKALGGLARSIDSLFASAEAEARSAHEAGGSEPVADTPGGGVEQAEEEVVRAAEQVEEEASLASTPDTGAEAADALDALLTEQEHAAGLWTEPAAAEASAEVAQSDSRVDVSGFEAEMPYERVLFEDEPVPVADDGETGFGEPHQVVADEQAVAETEDGEAAPIEGDLYEPGEDPVAVTPEELQAAPAADAEAPSDAAGEAPPADIEVEPSALEIAVESYLAGGGDRARVESLAKQHLESREYDAVAVAAERLVLGAGDPPAEEASALANELLTPMVRRRFVQRLGMERDEARRVGSFKVCAAIGQPMAEAIRDEMAEATDRLARRVFFDALIAMGDVSRPVIEAMAEDDNRFLARNGVAILGEIGGRRAQELVIAGLANTDPRVRRAALLAMARLKVEGADQLVLGLLDDTEESVRIAATVAAGELGVERAVRPLCERLDDSYEPDVVLPLLHALGQIADPGAVASIEKHAVKELFAKPRTEVRIAAYQALNHIGTPLARRLLNQAVSDKDPEVKAAVKELLHIR